MGETAYLETEDLMGGGDCRDREETMVLLACLARKDPWYVVHKSTELKLSSLSCLTILFQLLTSSYRDLRSRLIDTWLIIIYHPLHPL